MATLSDVNPEIAETAEAAELPRSARHFHVQLSSTPRGARLARLLTVEQLRTWDLPLDPDAAAHVVAELATNAVTHARLPGRDFRLSLYAAEGTLRIEVADARGDRAPEPQLPSPTAESGRGLILVAALANRWGITNGPAPRKTVWAELDVVGAHPEIQAKPHPSSRRDTDG